MTVLTKEEQATLRRALLGLREDLERMISTSADSARPVDLDEPIGRLSRMDAMQQQSMAAANRSAARGRLEQVEAALERFDADEYGECLACGEPIAAGRLAARPETPFCLACQSAREVRG